jgi:hypothetical protein
MTNDEAVRALSELFATDAAADSDAASSEQATPVSFVDRG